MADLARMSAGAGRAAEVLLRGTGGRSVLLRLPRPGAPGDATEQLGLAPATFDEVELAPVQLRPVGAATAGHFELLLPSRLVAGVAGDRAMTVLGVFAAAAGVVVDGALLRIVRVAYRDVAGVPYLYRLELEGPVGMAI